MKPAPFAYFAPTTLDEALALLTEHGYDAKPLAGGQSLIPTMNFRLAQPSVLIDLNRVQELFYLQPTAEGGVRIGAMTRQRMVERSSLVAERAPLLHEVMPHIAHAQIRNRGTIGGSLAHADPSAELPAVAVALDAQLRIRSQHGERMTCATDFYMGLFTTDLAPDELLTEIVIPPLPPATGWAFQEVARRLGDYAMCGCGATVTLDADGRCVAARLVYLSVGEGPTPAHEAVTCIIGERLTPSVIAEAARIAGERDINPTADIHASVAYRRHLATVLARRALSQALQRCL